MRRSTCLVVLFLLAAGSGFREVRASDFEGRWLFHAVTESGSRIPILVVEIAAGNQGPEASVLATTAPFEVKVKTLEIEDERIRLVLDAADDELTLTGELAQGVIQGAAEGAALEQDRFFAERSEQTAFRSDPSPEQEQIRIFRDALQTADPEERIRSLEDFAGQFPESRLSPQAYLHVFSTLLSREAPDRELERAAERYLKHARNRAAALNDMAFGLAEQGRILDRAERYVREALSLIGPDSPQQADFLDTLGWVLHRKGRNEEAAQVLLQARELEPLNTEVLLRLAKVRSAQGSEEERLRLLAEAYLLSGNTRTRRELEEGFTAHHGSPDGLDRFLDSVYERRPRLFDPGKFEGENTGRTVLAELFTGSECGPCQAADYAFEGLVDHYPENVLVVLEYHLPIPGPDPMMNPDSVHRSVYYGVRSTPFAVFGGVERRGGGGPARVAEFLFHDYQRLLPGLSAVPSPVELQVQAERNDPDTVVFEVRGRLKEPLESENLALRVALVERLVRYTGVNGVPFHHNVVRKMWGDGEGRLLEPDDDGNFSFQSSQHVGELEEELLSYLKQYEEERQTRFRAYTYDIDRSDLLVVAFVQDDDTRAVLQAAQTTVP